MIIGPKSIANNALSSEQRLYCALRFYATGTYQEGLGDRDGVSQSMMHRIIARVSDILSVKANDIIQFSVDKDIMQRNSSRYYGFKGSKCI